MFIFLSLECIILLKYLTIGTCCIVKLELTLKVSFWNILPTYNKWCALQLDHFFAETKTGNFCLQPIFQQNLCPAGNLSCRIGRKKMYWWHCVSPCTTWKSSCYVQVELSWQRNFKKVFESIIKHRTKRVAMNVQRVPRSFQTSDAPGVAHVHVDIVTSVLHYFCELLVSWNIIYMQLISWKLVSDSACLWFFFPNFWGAIMGFEFVGGSDNLDYKFK